MTAGYDYGAKRGITPAGHAPASTAARLAALPPVGPCANRWQHVACGWHGRAALSLLPWRRTAQESAKTAVLPNQRPARTRGTLRPGDGRAGTDTARGPRVPC